MKIFFGESLINAQRSLLVPWAVAGNHSTKSNQGVVYTRIFCGGHLAKEHYWDVIVHAALKL